MNKIGITVSKSKTQIYINQAYINYIANSGYEPILITQHSNIESMVDLCDGLVLPGGVDIEPTFYGENNIDSHSVDPERDDFERMVLHTFIEKKKPVFGICRGFQLIVREFVAMHGRTNFNGLSYYQHINNHNVVSSSSIGREIPSHSVEADMNILYGDDKQYFSKIFVNSIHHQALLAKDSKCLNYKIGKNTLNVIAYTEFGISSIKDKKFLIEGVNISWGKTSVRGVQWHPEELNDTALLQTFFGDIKNEEFQPKNLSKDYLL